MRRKLMLALAIAAVASLGVAAVASAVSTTLRAGNLIVTFGGNTSPKKLPRHKYVPVTTHIFGKIKTSDGTHPVGLQGSGCEHRQGREDQRQGLPGLQGRPARGARHQGREARLRQDDPRRRQGRREIAFPEQKPIKVPSPLLVFNGGEHGGKVTLLIHTFITVPAPTAIVTR